MDRRSFLKSLGAVSALPALPLLGIEKVYEEVHYEYVPPIEFTPRAAQDFAMSFNTQDSSLHIFDGDRWTPVSV